MDWKKFIQPAVIVAVITALVGVIYTSMASDLKEKADNQTIQMYILQQEKKDEITQKANELKQKELEIKQKDLEVRQRELELKQRELDTKMNILRPPGE